MRLCGLHDGRGYGCEAGAVLALRDGAPLTGPTARLRGCSGTVVPADAFERVGTLPASPDPTTKRRLLTGRLRPVSRRLVGDVPTATVHRLTDTDWLATVGRHLYTAHDDARVWRHRGTLAPSSGPSGVLPSAVCRHDGVVYLGEYPLGDDKPRILRSPDEGRTWETALELPGVRHVHAVQSDPFGDDVWLTTGDADAECHVGRLDRTGDGVTFEPVGGGSQAWRAVELAFTPDAVLWGVDCGYAESNRLYRLDRGELTRSGTDPAPTPVGATPNSVYYAASLPVDGDHVVAFATAVETGRDRTNPDRETTGDDLARVVVASAQSGFTDWSVLAAFRRQPRPADRVPRLPSANAYVYLGADADAGLFVNPFNTTVESGRLLRIAPDRLATVVG